MAKGSILTNGWIRVVRFALPLLVIATFGLLRVAGTFAQEASPVAGQTIRVNVARVSVGVVVTDAKGKFIEGLQREQFHVFDNQTEQAITEFSPTEEPGQLLLLIEAGPAVYFLKDANLFAATTMLNGLAAGDRVAIAQYTDSPLGVLDFTTDKQQAQAALDTIRFNLGFAELNLSSSLSNVLDWLSTIPGKKTIVLISTGVDTSPNAAVNTLRAKLEAGDVRILCISTSGPLRNGKQGNKAKIQQTQESFAAGDQLLQAIADATGGRAYFPQNAKAFQEAYKQIAQIVRHEYSLTFVPPTADGALHKIDVKIDAGIPKEAKSAELRIDHRAGYVAPKE